MQTTKQLSPGRDVCLFAFPMLIGNMLQSCHSIVDMAVVGAYVGANALAAVGNTAMILFIGGAVAMGFTIGGNVMVARRRGAHDPAGQRESVQTLLALSAIGGVLLTAATYALYRPLLRFMNIPPEALPFAEEYMDITAAGTFFVFGVNAVCAVMRGLGDSRRPMHFIAVAAATNAALDFLFVAAFEWGVRGAALATVLAQAASFAAAYSTLLRGKEGYGRAFRIAPSKAKELFRLGLPTSVHSAVLNVSYMTVTALFNEHGVAAAAAAGIGLKVNTFVAMPCWAVGQAVTTMTGHAMGAKNPERAAQTAKSGIAAGLTVTCAFLVTMHLLLRPFLSLFTNDPEVAELGVLYLRICCSVNFIPYGILYILDSFAVGAGSPVFAMANSLLQSVALRLGLSAALTMWLDYGFTGLCIAESFSPVIPGIIALLYFRCGKWRSALP